MTSLLLLVMAMITFFNRYLFFTPSIEISLGPKLRRFLSYSSYSVLTAIWMPVVFSFNNQTGFSVAGLDYLVASSLAAVLSFARLPSIVVVISSAAVFFLVRLIS